MMNSKILPPSSSLPPLAKLSQLTSLQISLPLDNLHQLYGRQPVTASTLPPKLALPIRKHRQLIHDDSVPDSGYASAEEDESDSECETDGLLITSPPLDNSVELLRADTLERAFAIRWVTGFIARSDMWASEEGIDEAEVDKRADTVEKASKILSVLLGDDQEEEEDCSITRSFRFPTTGGASIQAQLNDAPLSNEDHTSVGLQSWASSIVLSERICADPAEFSLVDLKADGAPLRVLELGAGTGLLSIVATKILPPSAATIFATDYHPDVLANLRLNIESNFPSSSSLPISVHQLDWESPDFSSPMDEPFDVILAADVVYHPDHARWIKVCAEKLLARPSTSCSGGVFWLMMALRITGRHEDMFRTVEDIFPDATSASHVADDDHVGQRQLALLKKIRLGKQEGVGRADERGYLLFKIGWVPA